MRHAVKKGHLLVCRTTAVWGWKLCLQSFQHLQPVSKLTEVSISFKHFRSSSDAPRGGASQKLSGSAQQVVDCETPVDCEARAEQHCSRASSQERCKVGHPVQSSPLTDAVGVGFLPHGLFLTVQDVSAVLPALEEFSKVLCVLQVFRGRWGGS